MRAGRAALIFSIFVIGLAPLTYSLKLQRNLIDHLKSELENNRNVIKKVLAKLKAINYSLICIMVVPLIPNVLVIAMPILHV